MASPLGRYRSGFFRGAWPRLLVITIVGAALTIAQPAHADPHAVFFTTVSQQQLFFNVLAALDQADYVETEQARRFLVEQRRQAGAQPEPEQSVTGETRTDLSAIISRSVTLEGDDLWTAYLSHQFAVEAARRRNTDEALRILCQRSLGREGCEDDIRDSKKAEEDKKKAFVVDPTERAAEPVLRGVEGVLSSNYNPASYDQQKRKDIATLSNTSEEKRPYPFDPGIAELNQRLTLENPQTTDKTVAVERLKATTRAAYTPEKVSAAVLDDINIDPTTKEATLATQNEEGSGDYVTRYTQKVADLVGLPSAFLGSAEQGANELAAFQAVEEQDGFLADSTLRAPKDPDRQVYTNISSTIDTPADVKASSAQVALDTLGDAEQNLAYAPPQQESEPGRTPLVNRQPRAAGATTSASAAGQVQGTFSNDPTFDPGHNQALSRLAIGAQPIGVHHEYGAAHLLKAIGYQASRGGCGCSGNAATNGFGREILKKINSL